jgi:DNA polymerase-3 subunit delta'
LFTQIKGQQKAVTFFERALQSNRLSHAYVFHGPDGVGKNLFARCVASYLFCQGEGNSRPCGRCPGCLKFASGNHPDLTTIIPDGPSIKIAQIRTLKKALTFAPFEKGYRVILVDDVHTMRREAGNSLLKLLEEPPAQNVFLLLSQSVDTVLPTIRSRCQLIPFHELSISVTVEILREKIPDLPLDQAMMLAQLSDGSPGQALALNKGDLFNVYESTLTVLLSDFDEESALVEAALQLAVHWDSLKDDLNPLLHLLCLFLKNCMVPDGFVQAGETGIGWLQRARERWKFNQLSDKIGHVERAERALQRNCNRGLTCEVLALHLLA